MSPYDCKHNRNAGEGTVSYLAVISLLSAVLATITITPVGTKVTGGIESAICRVVEQALAQACIPSTNGGGGGNGDVSSDPPVDPDARPTPEDDAFQPPKCILAQETTKTRTVMRILFIKISSTSQVQVTQWSDGTITVDSTGVAAGGVEGGLDIPGLSQWGGDASLQGSFTKGGGGGGRWLFDKHKTGDPQRDLELNHADAEQFIEYLKGAARCNSRPPGARSTELGMLCHHSNQDKLPPLPPDRIPDLDITRTTMEASGEFEFGGAFSKGDKKILSGITRGLSGTVLDDVLVLRGGNNELTFVYTMEIGGKMGAGYQAEGSYMQQVYVTYKADEYDKAKKEGRPQRPTYLQVVTSRRGADGNPGGDVKINPQVGPFTIQVEGGGGETETTVHTEVAELDLSNSPGDSEIVQNWLEGRGRNPAASLPTPRDFTNPLPPNASEFEKLMHGKGKISSLDYKVNIDWWRAAFAISLGVATRKGGTTGFKLFGLEISQETETQTLTGNPLFAGAPDPDGSRPWFPFTNCSKVKPVP
ncbi:hypothetical protein DPM19_04170 [Actinomadura craniellae]|uniref:Uncharacterized protein n=1 Tax=Actinomadura craniellae TaxID=2231787 RepID=A0A365HAK4_9ACTN|nr:hypothetical protein [Actinomadura craniellae]RAY16127.1 hypothetical protein DPM19_04170 [Actinomadura craniellae]